jgi:hypothetical protein
MASWPLAVAQSLAKNPDIKANKNNSGCKL